MSYKVNFIRDFYGTLPNENQSIFYTAGEEVAIEAFENARWLLENGYVSWGSKPKPYELVCYNYRDVYEYIYDKYSIDHKLYFKIISKLQPITIYTKVITNLNDFIEVYFDVDDISKVPDGNEDALLFVQALEKEFGQTYMLFSNFSINTSKL